MSARILARIGIAAFTALLFAQLAKDNAAIAQAAKEPKKKPVVAEPVEVKPRDALRLRALVQKPPVLKGVHGWTIETKKHRGYISGIRLSPDRRWLATGGLDGIIRIWDASTGEFVRALVGHAYYVYGLDWSPDGKTLASA